MREDAAAHDALNAREQEILARLAAGLSDQEIADDLYLSLHTVKWYNRQIYSKLGVNSRTQAIAHAARAASSGGKTPVAPPGPTPSLPLPPSPLVGRRRESAQVAQLLREHRLLTLTGAGGSGKTRLALHVAAQVAPEFAQGARFVDLAPLSDHTLVAHALARAIGVVENSAEPLAETLQRALAGQEVLLLIDNFEHVIQAAPLLSTLAAACPGVRFLVTSRESLRLAGEQEYPVPLLSLPPVDAHSVDRLAQSEAGALFVQRARMARPQLAIGDEIVPAIAHICRRLDGLALAVELAAARCKLLTPQALLERLEGAHDTSPLQALASGTRDAPPRQRSLRDTIAWSYNLLGASEQQLFARLAVFQGGCSLEAIEAVCGEELPLDVFEGLASLVDKSLVQQKETPGGEPRFVLLEMIHEYAREELSAMGDADEMRRRHAQYFAALAERAEPELRLAGYYRWCRVFELEVNNLRAVLDWAPEGGQLELGVRLASALSLFWYGEGYHVEGIRRMQRLLARLDETPRALHARFLTAAGQLAWFHDVGTARRLFTRALDIARELGDQLQVAWVLTFLSATMIHSAAEAFPLAEESLAMFRALGDAAGVAQALNIIGELSRLGGDLGRATTAYKECLDMCHVTGETRRICYMYMNLAYIAQHEGDYARGAEWGTKALRLAQRQNSRYDMANVLIILAGSAGAVGRLERAARLLGAAEASSERLGAMNMPTDQPEQERIVAAVRARLDHALFTSAWEEGRRMSLEDAVAYALEEAG